MNWLKSLFSVKNDAAVDDTIAYPTTYTVGWEIYTKDGTIQSRKYENVPHDQRDNIAANVEKETDEMSKILNEASKQDIEFVNLQGNILRLSDVIRISIVNKAI